MNENSPLKTKKITRLRQSDYGLYAWQRPNGKLLADTDHNLLNIEARYGDLQAIKAITEAAAYWGYPDGKAVFLDSFERRTDEEAEEEMNDLLEGKLIL